MDRPNWDVYLITLPRVSILLAYKCVFVIIAYCLCYYNIKQNVSIFLPYQECLCCYHMMSMLLSQRKNLVYLVTIPRVSILLSYNCVYFIITHGKKCLAYYHKKNSTLLSYPECLRYYGSPHFFTKIIFFI